jgi:hypothetical protein
VVREEDSQTHHQEDVGSNPDFVYWMDVIVGSYCIERNTIKVAKWGTPKKQKTFSVKPAYNSHPWDPKIVAAFLEGYQ